MALPARPLPVISEEAEGLNLLAELRVLIEHNSIPARGYLTIGQAALYLSVPIGTLRDWLRTKRLPHYKPGKELLFKRGELDTWMDRFRQQEGGW